LGKLTVCKTTLIFTRLIKGIVLRRVLWGC